MFDRGTPVTLLWNEWLFKHISLRTPGSKTTLRNYFTVTAQKSIRAVGVYNKSPETKSLVVKGALCEYIYRLQMFQC